MKSAIRRALPLMAGLMIVLLVGCSSSPEMQADEEAAAREPGRDYLHADPDVDEVMVFFGYQCGPCHQFYEQQLTHWLEDRIDVDTVLVPVLFDPDVEAAARGFHAAELLGSNPTFHRSLFVAYQSDPSRVATAEQIMALAAECCALEADEFRAAYESDTVERRMVQAQALVYGHGIRRTPSVMINRDQVVTPLDVQAGELLIDVVESVLQGSLPPGRAI